jgi:hypothetical protein
VVVGSSQPPPGHVTYVVGGLSVVGEAAAVA